MKACPMSWVQRVHIHKGETPVSEFFHSCFSPFVYIINVLCYVLNLLNPMKYCIEAQCILSSNSTGGLGEVP